MSKIVSPGIQKISSNITTRYNHFKISQILLHYLYMNTLQDDLKNFSIVNVTLSFPKVSKIVVSLFFKHVPRCHQNMPLPFAQPP
jgi:hypothetical protein